MTTPSLVRPPTTIPPGTAILAQSWSASDAEAEFQAAVMTVWANMLQPRLDRINVYGMGHRGDTTTLERSVKQAGLSMDRRSDRLLFMAELFRAWVARNPRRGLAYLRKYLNLLYPGGATVSQLWQNPALPYGTGMSTTEVAGWWLTSRVRVDFTIAPSQDEILRMTQVMRALVPARIVILARVAGTGPTTQYVGGAGLGLQHFSYTGTVS